MGRSFIDTAFPEVPLRISRTNTALEKTRIFSLVIPLPPRYLGNSEVQGFPDISTEPKGDMLSIRMRRGKSKEIAFDLGVVLIIAIIGKS